MRSTHVMQPLGNCTARSWKIGVKNMSYYCEKTSDPVVPWKHCETLPGLLWHCENHCSDWLESRWAGGTFRALSTVLGAAGKTPPADALMAWEHSVFLSPADLGGPILTLNELWRCHRVSPWGWRVCVRVCERAHGHFCASASDLCFLAFWGHVSRWESSSGKPVRLCVHALISTHTIFFF